MRPTDLIAFVFAVATHAGIAFAMMRVPPRVEKSKTVVEVEVRKKVEAPPVKIEEPPPPEPTPPPKPVVQKLKPDAPPPVVAPPPNKTPPAEPPKEPVTPVFGVTMESTTEGDSTFSVPVGNTTMIDPAKSAKATGPVQPLPAAPAGPPKPEYKPVSEVYIKTLPEIDGEACGKSITYPDEAERLGVEGEVLLRIELDEKGKIHEIKVLKGLGHGLDQVAVNAMRKNPECRFRAAVGTDGKAAAYVISQYRFNFELPR